MVSFSQKEIITEIKESGEEFENIIVGTYSLDSQFFEDEILKIFQQKDAKRIVLMIDSRYYPETFKKAKGVGVSYQIEPIYLQNNFHPKFILMTSEETGKLFIGSGNLTENGMLRDGDVFSLIDYDLAEEYPDINLIFSEMKGFLLSLSENGNIRSGTHKNKILKAFEVPWYVDAQLPQKKRRSIQLLHSVRQPILSQLKRILGNDDVRKITIMSPFFDLKGKVLHDLINNFCDNIQLYIQPDRVSNFPLKAIKKIKEKQEADISIFKASFESDINRFIHAKIFLFETDKGCYCLTGSANATFSGLLSRSGRGNVELCLLRYEKRKKSFDYLLKNNEINIRKIPVSRVNENINKPNEIIETPDIYIEEAELDGNKLFLTFSPSAKKGYKYSKIIISRPVHVKPIKFEQKITMNNQIVVNLSDVQKNFCEQSAFVTFSLGKGNSDKILKSNKRWITTQMLEKIPRKRDLRIVEKTNGRIGLIKLLNDLDDASEIPTMLLYYLQYLDFDWLAESLDRGRRKIVEGLLGEEGFEDQIISYDRFILTAEDVLEKIVIKHEKKFEHMVEEVEEIEDLEERVKKMFDLFVFLNKIEIWFIYRKEISIEKLYDIIHRMQLLVGTRNRYCYNYNGFGYFDKVKENLGKKTFLKLHSNLDVLPQFMVLSQIILDLAKKTSGSEKQRLTNLLTDVISQASINKNKRREIKGLEEKRIVQAIHEYEEFENFSISVQDLVKKTFNLIKSPLPRGYCARCNRLTSYRIDSKTFLCPKCARKQYSKKHIRLTLKTCRSCGYFKWVPINKIGLEFCEKDENLMVANAGRFYIPIF